MPIDLRTLALVFMCAVASAPNVAGGTDVLDRVTACQGIEIPEDAIKACTLAIKASASDDTDVAWAYNNRGLAHAARGDYLSALADYDLAIAKEAAFAPAYSNRGNAHAVLGDMLKALADHTRAVEIDPGFVSAWHNRGVDHEELGDPRAALEDYRKALSLDPEHRGSRIGLATANCRLGRAKASAETRLDAIRRGHIDAASFQVTLQKAGHYRGTVDGKFGKRSRAALRAWTRAGCLPVR